MNYNETNSYQRAERISFGVLDLKHFITLYTLIIRLNLILSE